ncbi:MAG: SsrA-binding protein SmpB [Vampirovibrionales bacterium]|jgi:SsrA-binding protein|nr:SsrA-binding protein SmpB [Vampirovibrionales bacterium]
MSQKHSPPKTSPARRTLAVNRKAYHNYEVSETYAAGVVLTGTEVKSLRAGTFSISQSFARISNGEVWLHGMTIQPYEQGNRYNHEPDRPRKLLLKRLEINKLIGKTQMDRMTLIPLKIYFERCWVKVDLGLCRSKQLVDKRETIKTRDAKREIDRAIKHHVSK